MRILPCALAVLALAVSASASADPKADLHDAFAKFMAAKSFRATVTDVKKGQQISSMEFVAPDRYHMTGGRGPEMFIVGDDGYMNMDGRMTKIPVPVGKIVSQFRNENYQHMEENGMSVTDLGDDMVDGEAAHAYGYTMTKPVAADAKVWVSKKSGLPLQVESNGSAMGVKSTTRVRYSDFDDPSIKIASPR